jgi:hypothetical protein
MVGADGLPVGCAVAYNRPFAVPHPLEVCMRCVAALLLFPAVLIAQPSRADGPWKSLFDGRSLNGWSHFRESGPIKGWTVVDGAITRTGSGGDIVTIDQFGDFELELEWKISPGGNSGIFYRIDPAAEATYLSGPEMQVLDDDRHADGKSRLTSAGACYGLYAAPAGHLKPVGQWNQVRIVARGAHVEHWLNGSKLLEYELWSPEWLGKVSQGKFAANPGYGRATRGHIAVQDHGDWVAYRNIRIREIK